MRVIFAVVFLIKFFAVAPVSGQQFSENSMESVLQSSEIAQSALRNPILFEGLISVIVQYNFARANRDLVEFSPAGYENQQWINDDLMPVIREINARALLVDELVPFPDSGLMEIAGALADQEDQFLGFYSLLAEQGIFSRISSDQMLEYLAAYAFIAYSVGGDLWERLSTTTGVWPLCVWR